jgi:hypothetical protein
MKSKEMTRREVLRLGGTAGALALWNPWSARAFGQQNRSAVDVDHIMWGVRDLDEGMAFIEEHTSIKAVIGGVHPNRGTRNALISLGERQYLEILAPDPAQSTMDGRAAFLKTLAKPKIITWAAGTRDIDTIEKGVKAAGYETEGIQTGSRKKPDGSVLEWRNLTLKGHDGDIIPFVIEWGSSSTHPSVDSPTGCKLRELRLEHPDPDKMNGFLEAMGFQVRIGKGPAPRVTALIATPKGDFELT